MDRRIVWTLGLVVLVFILWWALDHVLFPTPPVPQGVPSIVK